jgi:hypothetical protein
MPLEIKDLPMMGGGFAALQCGKACLTGPVQVWFCGYAAI